MGKTQDSSTNKDDEKKKKAPATKGTTSAAKKAPAKKTTAKTTAKKSETAKKPAAKKTTTTKKTTTKKEGAKPAAKTKAAPKKEKGEAAATRPSFEEKTETLSSDLISLTVTKRAACRVEFQVQTKTALNDEAKKKAMKALAKEVTIPGFRKGKAPTNVLLSRFPKAVEEETFKQLADMAYHEAQKLANCPLLNGNSQISYDLKSRDLSAGIDMVYSFESEPDIPVIDYSAIDLKGVKKGKVDKAKVDETIEQIRGFYATHDVIKDRAAKKGDTVLLDIEDLDGDEPVTVFKSARFEVTDTGMAEWMLETVVGLKPSESKESVSRANENDSDKIKEEFQPKKVRVTVVEIQEAKLPPIDASLAEKVGVKSVEDMESQLKKLLEKRSEEEFQEEKREVASNALLENLAFEIPKSILEKEFSHRFNHSLKDPQFKKAWDGKSLTEQEEYQRKIMEEAEKAIRLFYISRVIVQRHNIQIERPEEDPAPNSVLEAMFSNREMMHFDTKSEEEKAYLMSKLLLRKAQDFCIEMAK